MTPEALRRLLDAVASGKTTPEEALGALREFPAARTESATIDHHRELRCGFPEVIFGERKKTADVLHIAERLVEAGTHLLATRLAPEAQEALLARFPDGTLSRDARLFHRRGTDALPPAGKVAVVSAGTADLPVAEEAALTSAALGAEVVRVKDVGVAGLHRLLAHAPILRDAAALVVVAGMEGALPSVVAGLTDRPVLAVPTSVGYGAHFGGLAPLLAMLNSCAAGVVVVNIDNGFSAGYTAALVARLEAADPGLKGTRSP